MVDHLINWSVNFSLTKSQTKKLWTDKLIGLFFIETPVNVKIFTLLLLLKSPQPWCGMRLKSFMCFVKNHRGTLWDEFSQSKLCKCEMVIIIEKMYFVVCKSVSDGPTWERKRTTTKLVTRSLVFSWYRKYWVKMIMFLVKITLLTWCLPRDEAWGMHARQVNT